MKGPKAQSLMIMQFDRNVATFGLNTTLHASDEYTSIKTELYQSNIKITGLSEYRYQQNPCNVGMAELFPILTKNTSFKSYSTFAYLLCAHIRNINMHIYIFKMSEYFIQWLSIIYIYIYI